MQYESDDLKVKTNVVQPGDVIHFYRKDYLTSVCVTRGALQVLTVNTRKSGVLDIMQIATDNDCEKIAALVAATHGRSIRPGGSNEREVWFEFV